MDFSLAAVEVRYAKANLPCIGTLSYNMIANL